MKGLILTITIILSLLPTPSFSACIIGRQIGTDASWQGENPIGYRVKEGEIGIDKDGIGNGSLRRALEEKKGELQLIEQRIREIEKRIGFINDKEMEREGLEMELDRAKYKVLLRRKRELKARKEEIEKELEYLRKERDDLIKELEGLRSKKRILENEIADLEYKEIYSTPPSFPKSR